jgi:hypothetical protein
LGAVPVVPGGPFSFVTENPVDDRTEAAKKANYTGARPKDESKLSRKPSQIRNRLRRTAKKQDEIFQRDLAMMYEAPDSIYKPMDEWDLEELARGRPRNTIGKFNGKTPTWITAEIQKEAKRRLLDYTHGQLAGHIDQAVRTMYNLMVSTEVDENGKPIVDPKTKFAAAAFIIEHTIGKPKAIVEVNEGENVVARAIASAIVLDDGQPQGHRGTIEGEIVSEDEEEDDDA